MCQGDRATLASCAHVYRPGRLKSGYTNLEGMASEDQSTHAGHKDPYRIIDSSLSMVTHQVVGIANLAARPVLQCRYPCLLSDAYDIQEVVAYSRQFVGLFNLVRHGMEKFVTGYDFPEATNRSH